MIALRYCEKKTWVENGVEMEWDDSFGNEPKMLHLLYIREGGWVLVRG